MQQADLGSEASPTCRCCTPHVAAAPRLRRWHTARPPHTARDGRTQHMRLAAPRVWPLHQAATRRTLVVGRPPWARPAVSRTWRGGATPALSVQRGAATPRTL